MAFKTLLAGLVATTLLGSAAFAANLSIVSGATGGDQKFMRAMLDKFEAKTGNKVTIVPMPSSTTDQFGQYRLWLAAGNPDIDVYQTDVIWAPQLSEMFLDLTADAKDVAASHFPSIIASQTVNGKLVAIPFFTDAPALFYRTDLLEKYGLKPPATWEDMTATAKKVMDGERAAGSKDIWGFVFEGNSYEGLTCNALEWVKSSGGGQIVEPDGKISINNPKAAAALDRAKSWVGGISPPGVLAYAEEEARGVWQLGNSVFMRNWPYAYALGNGDDSKVKGKFAIVPLPASGEKSAATIGGWNLAVSKFSKSPAEAKALAMFLSSVETQKANAIEMTHLPTIVGLYDDADVSKAQPVLVQWKPIFLTAVPRPSAPTKVKYNEVSSLFWNAVHDTLAGKGSGAENLAALEAKIAAVKGAGWK
jgi:trehalose/maltose transport system substrate-binding protein